MGRRHPTASRFVLLLAFAVSGGRRFVGLGRVAMGLFGVLGSARGIALFVMLGRRSVRLGRVLVVRGGLSMCSLRHHALLFRRPNEDGKIYAAFKTGQGQPCSILVGQYLFWRKRRNISPLWILRLSRI